MLVGHEKQLEFLRESFNAGKTSHAYLFSGLSSLGKKTVALSWLSEFMGRQNHPDISLLNSDNGEIKISQIRELVWKLSLKPLASDYKAAVIDDAHLMNTEAQNALLKTLEEPRGSVFIFLITDQPDFLLPTIVSRTQEIKFYPVSKEKIFNFLFKKKELEKEKAKEILQIASGRPGRAIELTEDRSKIDSFLKSLKEIKKISESDLSYRFQYAKTASEDILALQNNLDAWLNYFRNILLLSVKGGGNRDFEKYSFSRLKRIIQAIQKTKQLISSTNANVRLTLEVLLMEM